MTRRKKLNLEIIKSNLSEAREELEKLERKAATGALSEVELQIGLQHAYQHLNFSWNIRRIPTTQYANLTQEEFDKWGRYPSEIESL
jgi:hypothetical protein